MTRVPVALGVAIAALVTTLHLAAVTRLKSADGQFWDIQDTSTWAQDSGGIATGGRANPFNGFGYLKLQVRRPGRRPPRAQPLPDRASASRTTAPNGSIRSRRCSREVSSSRARCTRRGTPNYLRYFDSFTNVTDEDRLVEVAWGGAAGAFEDGGRVAVATTSSGDRRIDPGDAFVTVMQNARGVDDPMSGPSGHGPSAHVLGSQNAGVLVSVGDMYGDPFTDPWPGLRPGPHRLRVPLHVEAGPDDRARDVRREGTERGVRPARRLSRADSQRHDRAAVRAALLG